LHPRLDVPRREPPAEVFLGDFFFVLLVHVIEKVRQHTEAEQLHDYPQRERARVFTVVVRDEA
jgi:hypothetical protein